MYIYPSDLSFPLISTLHHNSPQRVREGPQNIAACIYDNKKAITSNIPGVCFIIKLRTRTIPTRFTAPTDYCANLYYTGGHSNVRFKAKDTKKSTIFSSPAQRPCRQQLPR